MRKVKDNESIRDETAAATAAFEDESVSADDVVLEDVDDVDVDVIDDDITTVDDSAALQVIHEVGADSEEDAEIASFEQVYTPCNKMSPKARAKLETKKRLDAYLEKKRLKDSGWDEDDELFDDEFFSETTRPSQAGIM